MQQIESLKENYDFRRIYHRGISFVAPMCVIYSAKGRKNRLRLGITVSKKLGGAVERNRAKRVIRAAFRMCAQNIAPGNDFVIVARTKILTVKSTDVAVYLKKQLKNSGLWCENETDK